MDRRNFIKNTSVLGSAFTISGSTSFASVFTPANETPWFDKAMRWAQLAFVENDPGNYDPDFWLDYFRKIHADGVLLSAGGIVAFYPPRTHSRGTSAWYGGRHCLASKKFDD